MQLFSCNYVCFFGSSSLQCTGFVSFASESQLTLALNSWSHHMIVENN
uniref:Uncharacterized protein n=1 Tax=Rhizophora mucronata TaxID=61149 RepID=A0A2P2P5S7_RHIMU